MERERPASPPASPLCDCTRVLAPQEATTTWQIPKWMMSVCAARPSTHAQAGGVQHSNQEHVQKARYITAVTLGQHPDAGDRKNLQALFNAYPPSRLTDAPPYEVSHEWVKG